jgi:hypothetical protein
MNPDSNKPLSTNSPQASSDHTQAPVAIQGGSIPSSPNASSGTVGSAANSSGTTEITDEKAIDQAKKIIEATREDPYRQANEIAKFKVEYMKDRYGRVLKIE